MSDGIGRVRAAFERARERERAALVTYLMGGDPGPGAALPYLMAAADAGADILEVGMPFSDPVADGPTIQEAAVRALAAGTRPRDVLGEVRALREAGIDRPVVVMTYANLPYTMGYDVWAQALAAHGVDGAIIPDIPVEEAGPLGAAMHAEGLAHVLLAAPLTTGARLARVAAATRGFLYLVGSFGTTGARDALAPETLDVLGAALPAARAADVPLAVGFGVGSPDHVQTLARAGADGVVVGSALVRLVAEGATPEALGAVVRRLAEGCAR